MKLKKCLPLCFLLVANTTHAINSGAAPSEPPVRILETNIPKISLTAQESTTLMKLNSLSSANKNAVLFVLDSLYAKEKEAEKKKFRLVKQEDSEE